MATLKRKKEQQNGKHDQATKPSGEGGQVSEDRSAEVLEQLRKNIQQEGVK